jgi:hypothetical protein
MGEDKDGGDVDNDDDGLSCRAVPKPASILDTAEASYHNRK